VNNPHNDGGEEHSIVTEGEIEIDNKKFKLQTDKLKV